MPLSETDTINRYFDLHGIESIEPPQQSSKAKDLEALGWREWLMTLCPFAFEEEFSADHIKFWDLYWSVLMRLRKQANIRSLVPNDQTDGAGAKEQREQDFYKANDCYVDEDEYAYLVILGRGLAKSSTIEAAAVVRGCILGGYCLYVCEAQGQADEHLGNIKGLIEHPESRISQFYPSMAIDDEARDWRGKKVKNRTDLFITAGNWIGRAKGLNASLRGIRVGNLRPDNILIDDIDSVNDSIAVSMKKLNQLKSSVIPTQARRWGTFLVGQNIIIETGVINMIYTGDSDVLSARTVIGVSNTFEQFRLNLEYITYIDEKDGHIRHKILPSARPTWAGVRISDAQKFLNDSGLETFLAEYMNSFAHQKTGKVFEFEEARHVIPWSEFERVSGHRSIPGHWRAKASADLGYTKESISAWQFTARAARNAPPSIAGLYFAYRSMTFALGGIDDQAIEIWKKLFPDPEIGKKHFEATQRFLDYPELFRVLSLDQKCARYLKAFDYDPITDKYDLKPIKDLKDWQDTPEEDKAMFYMKRATQTFKSQIQSWAISHEATGAQLTLAKMYGIPAGKVKRFESDAGVDEANHLLRGDYTRPHPFFADEIVPETGLYRLGCPYLFFLVRRVKAPEDDRDMKILRDHVSNQRWTQEKLTDLGLTKAKPMKFRSDAADALRHFAVDYALPDSTPKTITEEVQARIPEKHKPPENRAMTLNEQMAFEAAKQYATEQTQLELDLDDYDFDGEGEEDYYAG